MNLVTRAIRKVERVAKFYLRQSEARRLGIVFAEPDYVYRDAFDNSSVIVDVGCADDAEFSKHMMRRYGLHAYGVDPTRKHKNALRTLEAQFEGKFKYLALAVTAKQSIITFHESKENQSGSILNEHSNVMNDTITTYEVESVTLKQLHQRVGSGKIDLLKLDLEGAEYDLFEHITEQELSPFLQIFVEFHHHNTPHTFKETKEIVQSICQLGFEVFSFNDHNYLFFK